MTPTEKEAISSILRSFLQQMDFPFQTFPVDAAFSDAAVEYGLQHYSLRKEDADSARFRLALHAGSAITLSMYKHRDIQAQYWMTLFTTCVIVMDDLSVTDPAPLQEFHHRFICAESQKHPLLDTLVVILQNAREHFNSTAVNLVVTSTLDFATAHILEYDYKSMKVHKSALGYPRYFRTLSGVATPYALFAFPPHLSLGVYAQVIPNMVNYINDVNDIFSFYKEEVDNEDTNHISLLARVNGWTKIQALQHLTDIIVEGDRATKEILAAHPEAYDMYTKTLVPGYIEFHMAAVKRYKLEDLDLEGK